jgi:hypothetical protein
VIIRRCDLLWPGDTVKCMILATIATVAQLGIVARKYNRKDEAEVLPFVCETARIANACQS